MNMKRDERPKPASSRGHLRGKRALVSGGGSGIGLATAERLAGKGAVPVLVDINRAALDTALTQLKDEGFEAYTFQLDITDIEEVRLLARELRESGSSPDILINCAGSCVDLPPAAYMPGFQPPREGIRLPLSC